MSDNNKNDFGYFGKGLDGYVHYKQSFDDNKKNGNFGNGSNKNINKNNNETEDSDFGKIVAGLIDGAIALLVIYLVFKYF